MKRCLKGWICAAIVGLALAGGAKEANATLIDSNSIVQDGIEYYIRTDKFVYGLGQDVEMLYRVTNLGDVAVEFNFDDQMQYHFEVRIDGAVVWFEPKMGLPAGSWFVLEPGDYKEYTETWGMINENGTPFFPGDDFAAEPGTYGVTGSLHPVSLVPEDMDKYVPVSVSIEVVPEPATFVLFGIGLAALVGRKGGQKNGR